LLTGARSLVVRDVRFNDQRLRFVGVPGVDKPRIVLVGYEMTYLEQLRDRFGIARWINDLVASGSVASIRVFSKTGEPLASRAGAGRDQQTELHESDAELVRLAIAHQQGLSRVDSDLLKVAAPIIN